MTLRIMGAALPAPAQTVEVDLATQAQVRIDGAATGDNTARVSCVPSRRRIRCAVAFASGTASILARLTKRRRILAARAAAEPDRFTLRPKRRLRRGRHRLRITIQHTDGSRSINTSTIVIRRKARRA